MTSHIFLELLLSAGFSLPGVMNLLPLNPGNRSCREQGGCVGVSAQDLMCYVGSNQQSGSQTDEAVIIISQYVQISNQYILYLKLIQCHIILKKNGAEHEAMYRWSQGCMVSQGSLL